MCMLCATWASRRPWGGNDLSGLSHRLEQETRKRFIDRILEFYGLELKPWNGDGYLVGAETGPTRLAEDLFALWGAVEQIKGIKCDPLSPDLLAFLAGPMSHKL